MAKKISRPKKLYRVLLRRWLKPTIYAVIVSFLLYTGIAGLVEEKHRVDKALPRFIITRVSDSFDETEFTHLLLTVQEMRKTPEILTQLKDYINQSDPNNYTLYLEKMLNTMNWAPQAFYSRAHKMFDMYDVYDRINRMDETIAFLNGEVEERRLPSEILEQIRMLNQEEETVSQELTPQEMAFVKNYAGAILQLKKESEN